MPYTPFGYTCTVWLCPSCVVDGMQTKHTFAIGDHVRIDGTYIHGTVCDVSVDGHVSVVIPCNDVTPVTRPDMYPELPHGTRMNDTTWRAYDHALGIWLRNAHVWCDTHDDDEIEQRIMCVECDEHYPHA